VNERAVFRPALRAGVSPVPPIVEQKHLGSAAT